MSMSLSARDAAYEFKKDLILKVAAEQFFANGYSKTKIEDIAEALHVTKPFIYYHYKSKLDLLEEVCGRTSAFAVDIAEAAMDGSDGRSCTERLRTLVRQFALKVIEERIFLSIYFRESKYLPPETQARFLDERRRFHVSFSRLLSDGRAAGEFRFDDLSVTGQTLTGMLTWIFNWYRPDGARSAEDVAGLMEGLVLAAVGVAPPV